MRRHNQKTGSGVKILTQSADDPSEDIGRINAPKCPTVRTFFRIVAGQNKSALIVDLGNSFQHLHALLVRVLRKNDFADLHTASRFNQNNIAVVEIRSH